MARPVSLVLLVLALLLPSGALGSQRQFSIMQDDANFLGLTDRDPEAALAEAKYLGVDMVRAFVTWSFAAPSPRVRDHAGRISTRATPSRATTGGSTTTSSRGPSATA